MPEPTAVIEETASNDDAATINAEELVAADTLVEDVSIDGMCGVY
jgi:mycofactocin precursor